MLKFNQSNIRALTTSILLSSVLVATAAEAQKRPRGDANLTTEERLQLRFDRLDSSGDAVINLDEYTANTDTKAERRFNRKDADSDGLLSLEEATTTRRGTAPDFSDIAEEIVECVTDAAASNELIIVPDATRFQSPADKFAAADSNSDGSIDLEEAQANALAKATEAFNNMDSDSDTFVSFEEFSSANESRRATKEAIRDCIEELTDEDEV